jgi:hypothetical protein
VSPRARDGASRGWLALLIATLAAVGAAEAVLLGLGTGFFTGGFNSVYVEGPVQIAGYFAAGAVLDLALVLGLWLLCIPLAARLFASRAQVWCAAALIGMGVPVTVSIAYYNLHVTLGRLVSTSLLRVGSAGSAASVVVDELPPFGGYMLGLAAAGATALLWLARRVERRRPQLAAALEPPPLRRLLLGFAAALAAGAATLAGVAADEGALHYGLVRKTSGSLLPHAIARITDWDRDGWGMLARPADPDPWDASRYPYAVDVPGNGIDENGVGGDHPATPPSLAALAGARSARLRLAARPSGLRSLRADDAESVERRPNLLLVYLESFRADLLDLDIDGRPVTPFLRQLAAEGARSDQAFVHSPWTLPSRAQLLTGTLAPHPGIPTLIDDFQARGYAVAWFSGQDDSYGGTDESLGLERADLFYDARQDVERRTSRTTASVSLQVSWKTLLERFEAWLRSADPERPHLVYLNFTDTHFPYSHDEIDDLLGVPKLERSAIRSDRAGEVFRAYANTATNVDLAISRAAEAFRAHFAGRPQAILVTGDHGQSFYETGILGHGQELGPAQTRVPFLVWGIGGEWPEPIAVSDVRGLLERHLFATDEARPARFVPDPSRRMLQYLGPLRRPERIAARDLDGSTVYDFRKGRAWRADPDGRVLAGRAPEAAALLELIHGWEAVQREAGAEATDERGRPVQGG